MPYSQSSEPGFESPFATVSKIGHYCSLHWRPCSLSCINEYLAIDSGGNERDLVLARNCCLARMLTGEAELVSEWTGLSGKAKSVKGFERSNGLDTALYKNYLYLMFYIVQYPVRWITESALQLGFSGKHSSEAVIMHENYSITFPPVYSQVLIYTAERTGTSWREQNA